jgi:hypothetical protein
MAAGKGEDEYLQQPGDKVLVQQWNFEEMAMDFLLDPVLFGNSNNLVNKSNPFGSYPTP